MGETDEDALGAGASPSTSWTGSPSREERSYLGHATRWGSGARARSTRDAATIAGAVSRAVARASSSRCIGRGPSFALHATARPRTPRVVLQSGARHARAISRPTGACRGPRVIESQCAAPGATGAASGRFAGRIRRSGPGSGARPRPARRLGGARCAPRDDGRALGRARGDGHLAARGSAAAGGVAWRAAAAASCRSSACATSRAEEILYSEQRAGEEVPRPRDEDRAAVAAQRSQRRGQRHARPGEDLRAGARPAGPPHGLPGRLSLPGRSRARRGPRRTERGRRAGVAFEAIEFPLDARRQPDRAGGAHRPAGPRRGRRDAPTEPCDRPTVRALNVRSLVAVPLRVSDASLRRARRRGQRARRFADADVDLLTAVANHVALAVDRAESFQTIEDLSRGLEDKVRVRTEQLRAANEELARRVPRAAGHADAAHPAREDGLGRSARGRGRPRAEQSRSGSSTPTSSTLEDFVTPPARHARRLPAAPLPEPARAARAAALGRAEGGLRAQVPRLDDPGDPGGRRAERGRSCATSGCSPASQDDVWQSVDLHEEIESSLTLLNHLLKDRITVERRFGDLPPVECIRSQIDQVFLNLLANAAQAITGPGRDHDRDTRGGRRARWSRSPTAARASRRRARPHLRSVLHDQARRRGDRTRPVHQLRDRQEARRRASGPRARPGGGAVFTLRIPARAAGGVSDEATVLLVDDEPRVLDSLEALLGMEHRILRAERAGSRARALATRPGGRRHQRSADAGDERHRAARAEPRRRARHGPDPPHRVHRRRRADGVDQRGQYLSLHLEALGSDGAASTRCAAAVERHRLVARARAARARPRGEEPRLEATLAGLRAAQGRRRCARRPCARSSSATCRRGWSTSPSANPDAARRFRRLARGHRPVRRHPRLHAPHRKDAGAGGDPPARRATSPR